MITKGQVLNDTYEIIERLGSGGGGIIYKAYHRRMQKYVAIKLIKDEIKGGLNNRSEVDMLKNLKNDFLPQVIDFVEDGNDVYTVMEFIEGQNFKQLIYSVRKFDEKHVRKYAVQLCRAVKYLHSQNPPIIHSDIKPANVMLTPQDNICLIDFNISMLSNNGIATAIGGSQGFAAPEQFKRIINVPTYVDDFHEETRFIDNDETEILLDSEISVKQTSKMKTKNTAVAFIDTRTDIYGIGATIYYMLTSRTPISGYVDFRGIRCSSAIKDIILKAMNPNPSKRFQSVSEMYKALLNNSYKKSKVPKYIALAFLAAGLCFAAIFGLDQLKSNMENHAVQTYNTDITTTVFIDEPEESVTTADGNDDNDVIQYYDDGVVKCLKTAQNDDGSYELTWYDWDGAKDIVETYSVDDKLSYIKVYNSHNGELSWEGVPELTDDDGYYFKRTVGENNNYSFSKSYVDKNKENHKVVYFDENENILYWRTYDYEYFDDGSRSTTWYDENKNKLYTNFYSNGKRTQRVYYNEDGTIKNIINYDNDEKPITETTAQTTVTTAKTTTVTQKTAPAEAVKTVTSITIKGNTYSTALTELSLSNMGLNNSDIADLKYMTNLTKLELDENNISDISVLSGLTNLQELKLTNNSIKDFSPVKKLKNLKIFKAAINNISDISFLSELTNIVDLRLGVNNISDISVLANLSKLEYLDLRANKINDISPLAKLENLSEIHIAKNNFTSLSPLKNQNNIKKLWIDKNQLQNISALSDYNDATIMIFNDVEDDVLFDVKFVLPNCEVKRFTDPWADVYGY
ncbi:MAG: protein kinase [Ruminococcus sp.]|nr:protein kinase [Ruminococcus sp.]